MKFTNNEMATIIGSEHFSKVEIADQALSILSMSSEPLRVGDIMARSTSVYDKPMSRYSTQKVTGVMRRLVSLGRVERHEIGTEVIEVPKWELVNDTPVCTGTKEKEVPIAGYKFVK